MYKMLVMSSLALFAMPLATMNAEAAEPASAASTAPTQPAEPAADISEAKVIALWFKKNGGMFSQSLLYGNAPAETAEWFYHQYNEAREAARELPADKRDSVVYASLKERFHLASFDEYKVVSRALRRYHKNREKYKDDPALIMVLFILRNGYLFSKSLDYENAVTELLDMYLWNYKEELRATSELDETQRSTYLYKRFKSKYQFKSRNEFQIVTQTLLSLP